VACPAPQALLRGGDDISEHRIDQEHRCVGQRGLADEVVGGKSRVRGDTAAPSTSTPWNHTAHSGQRVALHHRQIQSCVHVRSVFKNISHYAIQTMRSIVTNNEEVAIPSTMYWHIVLGGWCDL
jgi:hypothetical protein